MKRDIATILMLGIILTMSACGRAVNDASDLDSTSTESVSDNIEIASDPTDLGDPDKDMNDSMQIIPQTGWTTSIPSEYLRTSSEQGIVQPIEYETKDYAGGGSDIVKTAYVYLPYGYDENDNDTRYNILYLMHGWADMPVNTLSTVQKICLIIS